MPLHPPAGIIPLLRIDRPATRHGDRALWVVVFLPTLQVRDRIHIHVHGTHTPTPRHPHAPYGKVQRIQQRRNEKNDPDPAQQHLERELLDDKLSRHTLSTRLASLADSPVRPLPNPEACCWPLAPPSSLRRLSTTFMQPRSRPLVYGKIEAGIPIIVSKQTASLLVIVAIIGTLALGAPLARQHA